MAVPQGNLPGARAILLEDILSRIRTIKPDLTLDEELAELGFAARYFFENLFCHCDREGRCEDRPKMLQVKILPWDHDVSADTLLNELHPHFVLRYEVDGRRYLFVRNFLKHQRPHPNEPESEIPPPQKDLLEKSCKEISCRDKKLQERKEGKGKEGKGKEGNGAAEPPPPAPPKNRYYEFVMLSDIEVAKLRAELGPDQETAYILRLDGYIGQIGERKAEAKYKSHYHTILNWYRKDIAKGEAQRPTSITSPAKTCETEKCIYLPERPAGMKFPKDCSRCEAAIGVKS